MVLNLCLTEYSLKSSLTPTYGESQGPFSGSQGNDISYFFTVQYKGSCPKVPQGFSPLSISIQITYMLLTEPYLLHK